MSTVGIIANPASGKDIRRLVAHATVIDNTEKVNLVRRILLGLQAVGVKRVLFMPDYFGIVPRALEGLTGQFGLQMDVCYLEMPLTCSQIDSQVAAGMLAQEKVGCIIVLGGDGTSRIVAKGCCGVPILPISTGTNNVFPVMVEGTVAGLTAGLVATGKVGRDSALNRMKKVSILVNDQEVDIALVDAVVLDEQFVGSRAIWDVGKLRQIVATRGDLTNIGIASIIGALNPLSPADSQGISIDLGPGGRKVLAAIGPGLIKPVQVAGYRLLNPGDKVEVKKVPCLIAVDGEREVEIRAGDRAELQIQSAGPWVVDISAALNQAARLGLFNLD